ncbi:MAG: pyridoxamine 5'-phosphate oxidase [Armatimonadetes bacterium CG07_land_8_20_14_0_80_59_28]|nr:MAG: pyridoxamine 5'-phosphate oxidase [Armatimonadetes bacterium CG07_land_8_20_14_0_80_59_28]PJB62168.1 MAG: pyridoxamine 5'-phosphate oxidase [Armatimonadetes bacterium CG_4_9_14_3_um_filter_58_7]
MATLPEGVKELLKSGHNVWIATIGEDGWPNVSIKGSGTLLDDEHLFFADIFSKKTRANLLHNNRVAVGIFNPESKVAVQVKGAATMIEEGDLFDRVSKQIEDLQMGLPSVKYVVRIDVDSVWDMSAGPNAGERLA